MNDSTRAAEIIDRVRTLYKKGAPQERESIDVSELICEMLVLLRSEAHRYSIHMRRDLVAELPKPTRRSSRPNTARIDEPYSQWHRGNERNGRRPYR
jgi:hypothetical protein